MRFSIIIPTFNEASNIVSCIYSITDNLEYGIKKDDIEIIIVDGGSEDGTTEKAVGIAKDKSIKIIRMNRTNLPQQLNRGAREAGGGVLLFLHADCKLAPDSLLRIENAFNDLPGLIGGAFTMKLAGRRVFYLVLSILGNIFCRITRIYFGDRAMFIKKDAFARLSGFKYMAIMNDFDLSLRMKKAGRVILLKGPIISSSRKFKDEPFYRIIYLTAWSLFAFCRGVDSRIIRNKYYSN
jgi:glycosyltransferase involved in cell wall biosynthesis